MSDNDDFMQDSDQEELAPKLFPQYTSVLISL